jgi:D-alanine-D-alanine ligase-like ATP-grasp enzyme
LPGREFSVAIIKKSGYGEYDVMPFEILTDNNLPGLTFLTNQVKSEDNEIGSLVIDPTLKAKIQTLALEVFKSIKARDFGRIDIRLDISSEPCFLEANLMPGLKNNTGSYLYKAYKLNTGLSYDSMIERIVSLAFERSQLAI